MERLAALFIRSADEDIQAGDAYYGRVAAEGWSAAGERTVSAVFMGIR